VEPAVGNAVVKAVSKKDGSTLDGVTDSSGKFK
jgi:hypothetical protein